MNKQRLWIGIVSGLMIVGLSGCEREGPLERAGEEVDEAIDTVRDGEESTSNKVDDAVDEMRDGVNDAADEVRDN